MSLHLLECRTHALIVFLQCLNRLFHSGNETLFPIPSQFRMHAIPFSPLVFYKIPKRDTVVVSTRKPRTDIIYTHTHTQ